MVDRLFFRTHSSTLRDGPNAYVRNDSYEVDGMATTRTWKLQLGAAIASLALVSLLVLEVSSAAFVANTTNTGNSWTTGQVSLTDDDGGPTSGVAMFDVTGMLPGQSAERCIQVTYTGSSDPQPVKLYASGTDSGLGQYLDVTVTEGSGSTFPNCGTTFVADTAPGAQIVNSTLDAFKADTAGTGIWDPSATGATGESRTYKFVVTLNANTPDTAQGASAAATFTWETTT